MSMEPDDHVALSPEHAHDTCFAFVPFLLVTNTTTRLISSTWFWNAHIYGFAIAWFLMGLYAFVTSINLRPSVPNKTLLNALCAMLCAISIFQSVYLMVDPYEVKGRFPVYVSRTIHIVVHPQYIFLISACFLALVRMTKVSVWPYQLQNSIVLCMLTSLTLTFLVLGEILHCFWPAMLKVPYWLLHICFLLCCFLVIFAYFHYSMLMLRSLSNNSSNTLRSYRLKRGNSHAEVIAQSSDLALPKIRITDENGENFSYRSEQSTTSEPEANEIFIDDATVVARRSRKKRHKTRTERLRILIKACYIPACLCLLIIFWQFYEIIGQHVFPDDLEAWSLFVFATIQRTTEILIAATVGYLVKHHFNHL